ncbi:MAG TPA: TatD family hydrolase [Bacteroidales bacterium]|nr:TatD family hydrolase [Bacteroidales bacterium]
MQFVDTHAHLYLNHFDNDREETVKKAILKNVNQIILPNIDSSTIQSVKRMSGHFPSNIFPLMGLHPVSVKKAYEDELKIISDELETGHYYAIGESGIDLYHDRSFLEEQKKAFIYQTELAIKFNLPIIIHARESFGEIFEILDNYKNQALAGIFHAFSGTVDQAKRIIQEYGFFIGIGGIVTFKNAGLDNVVKEISLEHMVIETDAPFLAPVPYRGKRNESCYIVYIAEKIAQIKKISINDVADITTRNAMQIFALPFP